MRRGDRVGLPTPERALASATQHVRYSAGRVRGRRPDATHFEGVRRATRLYRCETWSRWCKWPSTRVGWFDCRHNSPSIAMRSKDCGRIWPIIFSSIRPPKISEIREQWGITRKHAVPIFEFFDQCQITVRAGDLRSAGPRISLPDRRGDHVKSQNRQKSATSVRPSNESQPGRGRPALQRGTDERRSPAGFAKILGDDAQWPGRGIAGGSGADDQDRSFDAWARLPAAMPSGGCDKSSTARES